MTVLIKGVLKLNVIDPAAVDRWRYEIRAAKMAHRAANEAVHSRLDISHFAITKVPKLCRKSAKTYV